MIDKKELQIGSLVNYEATTHRIIELLQEGCTSEWVGHNKEKDTSNIYGHSYEELKPIKITKDLVTNLLGFEKLPNAISDRILIKRLGRQRSLVLENISTPKELLIIQEENYTTSDCVVLHNYNYDGYLSLHKLQNIISIFA